MPMPPSLFLAKHFNQMQERLTAPAFLYISQLDIQNMDEYPMRYTSSSHDRSRKVWESTDWRYFCKFRQVLRQGGSVEKAVETVHNILNIW